MASPHRSIADIKDIILRPALTHLYLVQFPIPTKLNGGGLDKWMKSYTDTPIEDDRYNQVTEKINILCSEANLPGSTFMTHEINNDYTGQTERHAYRRSYDDRIDFAFYVDDEYDIVKYFHSWMTFISNDKSPSNAAREISVRDRTYNNRMRFPEDYMTQQMQVFKFEKNSNLDQYDPSTPFTKSYNTKAKSQRYNLEYNFVNAYPISINSMPVSYDQPSLLKCTVSFTYSRYWITAPENSNFETVD